MSSVADAEALGAHRTRDGVRFAVVAPGADAVDLCIVSPEDRREERRVPLVAGSDDVHAATVSGIGAGTLYAYRAHGRYAPREGARFNPAKRLVDPCARAIAGELRWHSDQSGFLRSEGADSELPDPIDSAHAVPPAVVVDECFEWGDDASPRTPLADSVIYECHVKGLTIAHPGVEPAHRGRYLGLASEPLIEHWRKLGVTAVELLPVQHKMDERHLIERGLTNYWGYSPIGWMAPDPRFASASDGAQVHELKTAVRRLHEAGIEVILDVVFNHSGEGDHLGPTVSLRGLGNAAFYDLDPVRADRYRDFSGCGAGLRFTHPAVRRLVLDSLRRWVNEYHVDGFRFDLAAALARENGKIVEGFGLLREIADDPLLGSVKLIAEPWDATGASLLGRLPEPWCEWNGEYRDAVRRVWRGEREPRDLLGRIATAIAGSSNVYGTRRCATASVNYVACHDGPTLADLTSYAQKHNEANREGNRDGPSESFASNWGVEGATTRSDVVAARALARRNMIATLALSLGVPMLQHGDELGRTQLGLDNGYCQDGPQTWMNWRLEPGDRDLFAFVCAALALRRSLAVFRRSDHFTGAASVDGMRDLVWLDPSGREMGPAAWSEATSVTALYDARAFGDGQLALLLNVGGADCAFALPAAGEWKLRLATIASATQDGVSEGRMTLPARSLALLQNARADGKGTT